MIEVTMNTIVILFISIVFDDTNPKSELISYGHDIEELPVKPELLGSELLERVKISPSGWLKQSIMRVCRRLEMAVERRRKVDRDRHWWLPAETLSVL